MILYCSRVRHAIRFFQFFFVFLAFAAVARAQTQESDLHAARNTEIDQTAMEIMLRSADFLASRPALAFNWFVSYDEVIDGREKLTFMRSGSNLLIREKGFYSRVEGENGVREYYYDQKTFAVSAPFENYYASIGFDRGFEALIEAVREATDTELPIHGILSRDLPKTLEQGLRGAAYLGITYIVGQEVHHLTFSDDEEDWQVWISTSDGTPLPLLIIGTNSRKSGWPQYRAHLSDWNLSPDITDGQFQFRPDSDDAKITMPAFKERIARGAGKAGEAARAKQERRAKEAPSAENAKSSHGSRAPREIER
ncbi:MAG: DUF2092 domain-containing protein [Hyphomicrobiaceae bacterium]